MPTTIIYLYLQNFAFSLKVLPRRGSSGCIHHLRSKLNHLVGCAGSRSFNKLGTSAARNYSTNTTSSLHPQFITGFPDAESSFFITFIKSNKSPVGYYIQLSFQIGVHKKDRFLLELVKSYFGVGNILIKDKDQIIYQVTSNKDLSVIICHFKKYPLCTQKRADFELFQMSFRLINQKEHLSTKGFTKILSFKAALNNGLSSQLKTAFPNITPHFKPKVITQPIKDPN